MKVTLAQTDIIWEDKEKNGAKAEKYIARAAKLGAKAIFFPEMSLTGFSMDTQKTGEKDRESVLRFCRIAAGYDMAVGIGWTGINRTLAENHYSVIDRKGNVISDYIKIHPFSCAGEDKFFAPGKEVSYFRLGGYTWSNFICYDLRFPELFLAASERAEVIVVAANWPGKREEHWKSLLKARAVENQCYILAVNCTGQIGNIEYKGSSCVISPEGDVLGMLDKEPGLLTVNLVANVKGLRESFPVKKDRQWNLYISEYRRNL